MTRVIRREPRYPGRPEKAGATYPVVRCDCGREVHCCDGWSNECRCGVEFNGGGQMLAPRHFWGEETGESFT